MEYFLIIFIFLFIILGLTLYISKMILNINESKHKAIISSKAKSFLMQKIAYEFRNPLNGIIGFCQMLEAGDFGELNPKQQERIQDIYQCGIQLENLVRNYIDLSKAESGIIELIETLISVNNLIEKAIEELKGKIKANEIRILMDIENPNLKIFCDQKKLIHVLKSIIDNAIKFSPKSGQVTIRQSNSNKQLRLSISDSGAGMSSYELDLIFLFPDDNKKAKNLNGLGMGMPLAKLFVELHGGNIIIDSEEKLGTTVTITVPEYRIKDQN